MTWLWTNEAAQAGRFSLKQVSTAENVSDLTTKYHVGPKVEAAAVHAVLSLVVVVPVKVVIDGPPRV